VTGGPDRFRVDADDLAELADDHHLCGVVDEVDADDFADLEFAFMLMTPLPPATAGGRRRRRCACRSVLGDGEDEAGGEAELLVELLQLGGGFGAELGCGGGVVSNKASGRLRLIRLSKQSNGSPSGEPRSFGWRFQVMRYEISAYPAKLST
jgi:hypothetical protein